MASEESSAKSADIETQGLDQLEAESDGSTAPAAPVARSPSLLNEATRRHLIRFPEKQDRLRALAAFLGVREIRTRFPGDIMGVSPEHIRVLMLEKIPFEYVSKAPHGPEIPPSS